MRRRSSSRGNSRRGAVAVLVAVCLTIIVGTMAFALDGGLLLENRRLAQSAADAAALAAAADLFENYPRNGGLDPQGTARAQAESSVAYNAGAGAHVTVNIPPRSGEHAGMAGYVEVNVQLNQARAFSSIFGKGDLPVGARSVARGRWESIDASIVLLEPKKGKALEVKHESSLTVEGSIYVNSSHGEAVRVDGRSDAFGSKVYITGGYSGNLGGDIHTGEAPLPDPLLHLPAPTSSGMSPMALTPSRRSPLLHLPAPTSSGMDERKVAEIKGGKKTKEALELFPGYYKNRLKFTEDDYVFMHPGTYYLEGGIDLSKRATLEGDRVTLFNPGKGKSLKFGDQATVRLSPPTSGLYEGLTIFQDRGNKKKIKFQKGTTIDISGTIYAPNALIHFKSTTADFEDDEDADELDADDDTDIADDGEAGEKLAAQFVCRRLKADKHADVHFRGGLTARSRDIRLVE